MKSRESYSSSDVSSGRRRSRKPISLKITGSTVCNRVSPTQRKIFSDSKNLCGQVVITGPSPTTDHHQLADIDATNKRRLSCCTWHFVERDTGRRELHPSHIQSLPSRIVSQKLATRIQHHTIRQSSIGCEFLVSSTWPCGQKDIAKKFARANLFFHSSFFLHHFPDDAAQRRTAPLARQTRARIVRAVLGIARVADRLRGNGARGIAQTGRIIPALVVNAPAAVRPLADGRFPKTGTSVAQRPRPRKTSRPRQPRPRAVSFFSKKYRNNLFSAPQFSSHFVGAFFFCSTSTSSSNSSARCCLTKLAA